MDYRGRLQLEISSNINNGKRVQVGLAAISGCFLPSAKNSVTSLNASLQPASAIVDHARASTPECVPDT